MAASPLFLLDGIFFSLAWCQKRRIHSTCQRYCTITRESRCCFCFLGKLILIPARALSSHQASVANGNDRHKNNERDDKTNERFNYILREMMRLLTCSFFLFITGVQCFDGNTAGLVTQEGSVSKSKNRNAMFW